MEPSKTNIEEERARERKKRTKKAYLINQMKQQFEERASMAEIEPCLNRQEQTSEVVLNEEGFAMEPGYVAPL